MLHAFSRAEMLLGREGLETLKKSRVAVFGIGGVGTFVVEGLVRSGVGKFLLVDDDCICLTNLNRQLHATRKTIGESKVEAMKNRILEINPDAEVAVLHRFYMAEKPAKKKQKESETLEGTGVVTIQKSIQEPIENGVQWEEILAYHQSPEGHLDYIVDAIDTVSAKLDLITHAKELGIPVISAMGAGNKLDPTQLVVADIYKTSFCPLARVMRQELKKRGVKDLKVVYSKEPPMEPICDEDNDCNTNCVCPKGSTRTCSSRRSVPGSVSFVPSVSGLIIAGEVVKDLIGYAPSKK